MLEISWLEALAPLAGMLLFTRIHRHSELDNATRKGIFDAVCGQPGLGVHALASHAGISYSTACYHLERLVSAGMIVMTPDGNKLRYYKNGGAFSEAERKILPVLKNVEASRVLEAILETPGTYRAELAERLGVTPTTINWHLRRLREAGLIDEVRRGRNAYLRVPIEGQRETLLALADKVASIEPAVAQRIRGYLGLDAPGVSPVTAA